MKNKVTLIIPTHEDRTHFLHRALTWYDINKFTGRIIVADSSPEKVHQNNFMISKFFDDLNVKLLYLPKEDYLDIGKIMHEIGRTYLETDYVTVCGDDDFQIPAVVDLCKDFLDNNSEYIGAHGGKIKFEFKKVDNQVQYNVKIVRGQFLDTDDTLLRFSGYMRTHTSPQYHLMRKEIFQKIYYYSYYLPQNYFLISELLPCSLYYISGKVKRLSPIQLYMEINNEAYSKKIPDYIIKGINSPEWGSCVQAIKTIVVDELVKHGINKEVAENRFDREFNVRILTHYHDQIMEIYEKDAIDFLKWYNEFQIDNYIPDGEFGVNHEQYYKKALDFMYKSFVSRN